MRFVTIAKDPKIEAAILWDDDGLPVPKVVGHYASLDEVPDLSSLEVFRFDVETSQQVGVPANQGNHPTYDVNGAPLWKGARVKFVQPSYYTNTVSGYGEMDHVDVYGGAYLLADESLPAYDRGGIGRASRRQTSFVSNIYNYSGPLKGARQLKGMLGNKHEHGETDVYVRLTDDPRRVATLEIAPSASPRPG